MEESLIAPALDARGCRVIVGRWRDEYTGAVYTDPNDVEIDHRVPLANAHRSGGWAWDRSRKRDYANDLLDPEHLVAVGAETNRIKGTKGRTRGGLRSARTGAATRRRGVTSSSDGICPSRPTKSAR